MRNAPKLLTGFFLITALAAAQFEQPPAVTRYKLYDVGVKSSFTGFYSVDYDGGVFSPLAINDHGQLAGFYFDLAGFAGAYLWDHGQFRMLPNLPHANDGGGGSNGIGINNSGLVIGIANNGQIDPANGILYNHAVSWTNGNIQYLGDLGGNDSNTNFVNNAGLIVGYAYNTTPDPYSFYGTQYHAVTWLNGAIQDLGTLGGTDSEGWLANDQGQVVGISFLDTPPVPPFNQPQDNAFLWSNGVMTDLGTLGGGFSTPTSINQSGQVDVLSFDATNSFLQSFQWTNGTRTILKSAGGNNVEALALNDAGTSVGANSDASNVNALASSWDASGASTLLGAIGADTGSLALGINNHGVIVGGSGSITFTAAASYAHAFIWQRGHLQDLNTLIPAGSPLTLNVAYAINNKGVIAGEGTDKLGNLHAFVMVPESTSTSETFPTAASAPAAPESVIKVPSLVDRLIHKSKRK